MILWAGMSLLWSGSPDITLRRVIAILLTTLYALALYLRYNFALFLRLLGMAFLVAIFSSLVMVVVKPDWGIMSSIYAGAWEGVFVHKNTLGKISVFAMCIFAALQSSSQTAKERVFWFTAFLLGTVTLVGSRSVTAMLITIILILAMILFRVAQSLRKGLPLFLLITLSIGSSAILLVIQNSAALLDALGRDISLTGRIPLWNVLIPMGLEHPLGYGYGAFWLGWNGPSAEVWSTLQWFLPNAHNGFLELWLNLGWLGLGLGLILLGKIFAVNLAAIPTGSKQAVFWIVFCIVLMSYNFVEVNFFNQNNIYWILIVYAYLSASSCLAVGRIRRR
jgi:O-antigen ligase